MSEDPESAGKSMTLERLQQFNEAWSQRDVERLMEFVTEDCVYGASVGPEPGQTFVGKAEVRAGFEMLLSHDAKGKNRGGRCFVLGDVGIAEWSYLVSENGDEREIRGCDIFEFKGDKISKKDAFRKTGA